MNSIYEKYIASLRAFVQGTAPEAVSPEERDAVFHLAAINGTWGIVGYTYMNHPQMIEGGLPPAIRKQCLYEITLYARRAEQMKLLLEELDKNGIDCILFKGFVLRQYYPIPELRTFGDIDFVIRKEHREKSHGLMQSMGYEPRDTWEPAYSYWKEPEYYEIHTDVMEVDVSDKADYTGYYADIWAHVQPSKTVELPHVLEFSPEYHFLYLLTHIAKHINGSGAGIRMYLDIAFFIQHFGSTLDWKWISGELKTLRFEAFANMTLTAVERWFGVKSPLELRPVPEQVLADFLDFTLEGGTYGYVGRDKGLIFLKQQGRNDQEVSRFKTLLYHALPPANVMENRYPYLQKHRWLLPAAWVQRLVDSRKEWNRFADHTKDILQADEDNVKKLKRIYKEIGL